MLNRKEVEGGLTMQTFEVQIIKFKDGEVEHRISCKSLSSAERVESGVNININHDDYYTKIKEIRGRRMG